MQLARIQHVALKGTRDGLILYLDPAAPFSVLIDELENHLRESAQFLQGASVRCFAGDKQLAENETGLLTDTLARYDMQLTGWLSAGEVYASGRSVVDSSGEKEGRLVEEGMVEGNSLFVERTLRSGQSVQFDGHVIILGDVNPGAEVVASGNIVVLGALRGVAHAGASGDRERTVSAYQLAPTQLRIADLVTRAPAAEEAGRGPEVAKIKNGSLIVEAVMTAGRAKGR